ncbi:MAG: hypothetical protein OXH99_07590 [Bryobacterales bacterium]|nr:hypothetical protein [Bryobacterales bacterium]
MWAAERGSCGGVRTRRTRGGPAADYLERYRQLTGRSLLECPACGQEAMLIVAAVQPGDDPPPLEDTS